MNRHAVYLALVLAAPVAAQSTQPARSWLTSIDAGYIESQKTQKPVLVLVSDDRFGSAWDKPLADAKVAPGLAGWVLVRLGPEHRELRQQLGVAQTPALRAMSPAGRVVARLDGFAKVEQLAKWLDGAVAAAVSPAGNDSIASLVASLASPDAVVREAAARQLFARRAEAATAVVDALTSDNATPRLAAADLLEAWEAPLEGIDPWQRSSVTPQRLAELKTWAETAAFTAIDVQPYDEKRVAADLDQLLGAASVAESRAVRERLVRYGEAVLPAIYQRLRDVHSTDARTRLTALRYRVVAGAALAAAWPGGFDRLAAADAFTRRSALDELSNRVTADDGRLLLELFSDDDSVVRERALARLKATGGDAVGKWLIRLLADPEPNVRAAVLKALVAGERNEKVDPALAPEIARYVAGEKDADLIVHAVHVLKAIPGQPSADALGGLLSHGEWRVRAEAADALREKLNAHGEDRLAEESRDKLYAQLTRLLDDEEGFVVAKAVAALAGSRQNTAVEPLLRTVDRRPEMAAEILKVIAADESLAKLAMAQLKPLVKHARADVRASAVTAIAAGGPLTAGAEIKLALADVDARVRGAGVSAAVAAIGAAWPEDGYITRRSLLRGETREKVDMVKWVDDFRAGKGRPAWMGELAPPLKAAMADGGETSLHAAVALCALGHDDAAYPPLLAAATQHEDALDALRWLPWDKRRELFAARVAAATNHETVGQAITHLAELPDPRAIPLVWDQLPADLPPDQWGTLVEPAHDALEEMYFGEDHDIESLTAPQKKFAREQITRYATTGTPTQKLVATTLMLVLDQEQADKFAAAVMADPASLDALRVDALHLRLVAVDDPEKAAPIAVAALADPRTRSIAVRYLAAGQQSLNNLRGIYLSTSSISTFANDRIMVEVPKGLTAEPLREALKDSDRDVVGFAAYLLVLLGERDALPKVEAMWRSGTYPRQWSRLMYRAIAKMNDDSTTPILAEIYSSYGPRDYQVREFYWTISSMSGENVEKLRKKIRTEAGMDRLK